MLRRVSQEIHRSSTKTPRRRRTLSVGLESAADVRAHRDPDLLLVEAMLAPPPLADARRSLEYWERRQKALPLRQRRARREAREMATRWETRVHAAERAQFESSPVGRILSAVGLSGLFVFRVRLTKRRVLSLAW